MLKLMKNNNCTLFIGLSLSALLIGCSGSVSKPPALKLLEVKRSTCYRIQADELLDGIAEYYQPIGSERVYFLSPERFTLHQLDVNKGKIRLVTIIPNLPYFNAFSVNERKQEFTVYTDDSVVIYNWTGKHLEAYSYNGLSNEGYLVAINRLFLPVTKNGKQYVHYFSNEKKSYKDPHFFQKPVEAEWDPTTNKVRLIPQVYPSNFQQYCYGYNYLADRIEIDASTHGYTFPYNDSIFFCDIKTGKRSSKFFGSYAKKKFKHIRYDEIPTLHESVFDQLVAENPYYMFTRNFPLAGYYTRLLLFQPTEKNPKVQQHLVVFDWEFNYVLETKPPFSPNILVDSKKGLLSMEYSLKDHVLILDRLSW